MIIKKSIFFFYICIKHKSLAISVTIIYKLEQYL